LKILITGGCGYKGSVIIPLLLKNGHKILNIDTQWFGNNLPSHKNLTNIKCDIRNINHDLFRGINTVIHLANIANDPAVDLNPTLSWEVNVLSSKLIADNAIKAGVNQIIYASSGSVYGIKEEEHVTEDLDLVPISVYNKTKMIAERVFISYADKLKIHCIRPATVCGLSPRMRLDVSVNLLTFQALKNKKITVFGGSQTRPNIHIKDMAKVYLHFLENDNIPSGFYNAGFENISILDIAKLIQSKIDCEIEIKDSKDPRSYRLDSTKLIKTGFSQENSIENAINELIVEYEKGSLKDREEFYTVKWMKSKEFK
tara:strand:+ start:156 stop:1097 length:942 start_codon:yes stop_codon:yes gene_type:complete